eukprot:scpid100952/ scgid23308/ 
MNVKNAYLQHAHSLLFSIFHILVILRQYHRSMTCFNSVESRTGILSDESLLSCIMTAQLCYGAVSGGIKLIFQLKSALPKVSSWIHINAQDWIVLTEPASSQPGMYGNSNVDKIVAFFLCLFVCNCRSPGHA